LRERFNLDGPIKLKKVSTEGAEHSDLPRLGIALGPVNDPVAPTNRTIPP